MTTRTTFEKRSILGALQTYLTSKGWTTIDYGEGFKSQKTIELPKLAISYLPSKGKQLQLGYVQNGDRIFTRRVQIDVYMESEPRTDGILDDIMDFLDLEVVSIVDPSSQTLGTLICYDTESILGETLPPATAAPTLLKWRGTVQADMEAHYPNG